MLIQNRFYVKLLKIGLVKDDKSQGLQPTGVKKKGESFAFFMSIY